MNVTDIIANVRIIINEALPAETDDFTRETDEAIRFFIRAAMAQIASSPTYRDTPVKLTDAGNVAFEERPDGYLYAVISPPADFLRPVSVFLEGWVHPVYTFHSIHSELFRSQYTSAPGVANGPNLPVAFLTKDNYNAVIAHSVTKAGTYELRYIPVPVLAADGTMSMPDVYKESLSYTAAALYLQSVNEFDSAKAAFDTAGAYLQTVNIENIES